MAQLLVREIDESLVQALRERAVRNGRSAEAEHREILAKALSPTKRRTVAEALMCIPSVGTDEDFARVEDSSEARPVPR
jgi:plasmid stability protein